MTVPLTWVETTLADAGSWGSGGTPKRTEPSFFGGDIGWLTIGDLNDGLVTGSAESITEAGLRNSSAKLVPPGTVLIAMYGSIGKMGLTAGEFTTNQAIAFCQTDHERVEPKFLFYYLRSQRDGLAAQGKGGTQQNISQTVLKRYPFLLPPLAEQKQIAAKLDALLAQVDTIKARLEAIPAILKRFRQSVLAAAVSGRLTEDWRGTSSTTLEQSPVTIGAESDDAPGGWSWEKLSELAVLESGHTPRKSIAEYWEGGDVYWISLQDIRSAHGTVSQNTKHKPTMLGIENSSARLLPAGTVCFSRDISVGFTTIMGKEMSTTQHFANWICGERLNNHYLMYSLMRARDHLITSGQGTTVKTIYMPALREFRLLTPPVEEQEEIVRRVGQLFAFADQIEQRLQTARARVYQLTQSILAKAFRGELTAEWREQNPELISGENSAEALLSRIRQRRAQISTKPRRRRQMTAV